MATKVPRSTHTWPELIQIAVDIEESGRAVYGAAARESKGKAERIFDDFSAVKTKHAETLNGIRSRLPEGTPEITFNRTLLEYLERGRRLTESFGSTLVMVEFSINFEEEALRFYRSLLGHAPESLRTIIQDLVQENEGEVEKVRTLAMTTLAGLDTPKGI